MISVGPGTEPPEPIEVARRSISFVIKLADLLGFDRRPTLPRAPEKYHPLVRRGYDCPPEKDIIMCYKPVRVGH